VQRVVILIVLYLTGYHAYTQDDVVAPNQGRKGQAYVYWGYNRAFYQASDIHFRGEHYNFTLHRARAEDMPERFSPGVYFNPRSLSIPQFNFRAGYFFGKNTSLSLGWDHMKYRLVTTQRVKVSGYIDPEVYPFPEYNGTFDHTSILYQNGFMDFHHSDGFNFVRASIEHRAPMWVSRNGQQMVVLIGGVSGGAMLPWTDFTFFGQHHRNKLHLAGYGVSANVGCRFEFLKWMFFQFNMQSGLADLRDIVLEDHLPSRASQRIVFLERSFSLGGYIPVKGAARI